MNPVVVKMKVLPPEDSLRPPRRGRPPGSTGAQIERIKYHLAFLVVSGQRNIQIAKALGVCPKTIAMWLQHPAVQEEIRELEADSHRSTQRLVAGLFRASAKRLRRMIRKGDDGVALQAIQLLWRTHAQLTPANEQGTVSTSFMSRPSLITDDADAKAAMSLLKQERRRLERENLEMIEQRPAE